MNAAFFRAAACVSREEWRAMARNKVALTAALLLMALTLAALLVSHEQMRAVSYERGQLQQHADEQWNAQPDRHPHRVVHYGHYVFRPLTPLAFFDFGVDPYTGHTLFLEGHRQNSANFSAATQSSVLLRFGQATPAFALQTIAPLLIVFLAFGSVARERERGQLRLILAQGVPAGAILAGKLFTHGPIALLTAAPALLALAVIGALHAEVRAHAAWLVLVYSAYLLMWSAVAVLLSAAVPHARDALLVLVAFWMASVILLPRVAPELAAAQLVRPTRIEAEVAIHKELMRIGDSHNPDDPHFQQFRARTLAAYGVSKVEDLPVNYGGLVIAEGERLTSELFDSSMRSDFERQAAQAETLYASAWLSPVIALRRMSMALAGTDRASHEAFVLQGEAYRYALIQALNKLHAHKVQYKDDRDQRISSSFWRSLPRFQHTALPFGQVKTSHVLPALAVFAAWFALLVCAAFGVARHLERNPS